MVSDNLTGLRLFITGGASGMAGAAVTDFASRGARIFSVDVQDEAGEAVAKAAGDNVRFQHCDVSDPASVQAAFAAADDFLGGLDALIHAAAIAPGKPAIDISPEGWDKLFAINTRSTLLTNQAAYHRMKGKGGRIVNFASGAGVEGMAGKAHYAASKGAVLSWTRSIAREWGPDGISVNAVCPAISTPMYAETRSRMSPEQLAAHDKKMAEVIPLGGKLGDPVRDFLPVIRFLIGPDSRFVTGQTYQVDGGMVMVR